MNNEQSHIIDDLLVKQLLGEATAAEQAEVAAWLGQSEANRKHYGQLQLIWDNSKQLAAKSTVDTDACWTKFKNRIAADEQPATKTIPLAPRGNNWMRAAASLVVLVGLGWLTYFMMMGSTTTYMADGVVMTKTLPDGTVVTLNKGSEIAFNSRFNGDTRSVTLKGEAFFDVTPDKSKPFVITADNAEIKVVGTSFNVKSSSAKTEVIVETGIVEVSKKKNMVTLKPKEKAIVLQSSAAPVVEAVDDVLYNYYRTKELVCNNTPLWRLVAVLNDAYNTNITIGDKRLNDLAITTTFKNESLDGVLNTISATLNVKVEKNGNNIVLR